MEVTPYASKPLSSCQGSRAWPGLTRTISRPLYAILICAYVLIQVGLLFFLYSLVYSFLVQSLSRSVLSPLGPLASVHLLKVLWQPHLFAY